MILPVAWSFAVRRILLCCVAVIAFALSGRTEPEPPRKAELAPASVETLIRLSVQPARCPRPALRYLFLPEMMEMNPGNPVQNYLKCFMEQQNFWFDKDAYQRRDKLLTMPLKELPAQELQDYGRFALTQADWAARLDKPDWQILLQTKTEGIGLLIPDVQQLRAIVNALKVRLRAEIALGRFDDAIRTYKTMFSISRHLSEHPTLIGDLVGIATAFVTLGAIDEMLEQPGCPNLYWALTNLPRPFIPLDKGLAGERVLLASEFRDLDDKTPMSAEQLKKFVNRWDPAQVGVRRFLDERLKDEGKISAARRRLAESGIPEEPLARFPPEQVILLDEKLEFAVRRDEGMRYMSLPYWQLGDNLVYRKTKEPAIFADALVPAFYRVYIAQGRLEQRFALLRHVEAIRLYAAEHDGKLPAKLSEITVPLPDDPFTGKPFHYEVTGTTAHLRGTPPRGEEKAAAFNIHYEVTIQK
jgi:hypothetical protein